MAPPRLRRLFLVIDDDPNIGEALSTMIREMGHDVEYCADAAGGLQRTQELQPAVVLLDVCLGGEDGLALLERVREASPGTAVIMISAFGEAGSIVKAMKRGASDFLSKPLEREDVRGAVENVLEKATLQWEVEHLREQVLRGQLERRRSEYDGVFENSPRMKAIKEMIDQVADTDATVLVWGESGVGKELVARAIHDCSPRRERTFVKVNCAALPLELLESELFGYERGAFTGAHKRKLGKFELADGGTIFLDEIGEMPLPLQAKLLHVLQDREFARLGSGRDIKVDVRVVASTNKDLERAVAQGGFREDLYYRLNVVNILVPPLRDRPEEIPILAEHFWQKYSRQYNRAARAPVARHARALPDTPLAGQRARAGKPRQAHRRPRERGVRDTGVDGPGFRAGRDQRGGGHPSRARAGGRDGSGRAAARGGVPAEADGVDPGCRPQGRGTPGGPRSRARGHQAGAGGGSLESGGGGTATQDQLQGSALQDPDVRAGQREAGRKKTALN